MAKTPAPLLGFNNNVRHRGRIFHIQTEDSGVKSPRIVTHLFADGGRIVKTTRTDYAEHVGQKDMAPVVRKLMKEQHKGMFISLRAGELDVLLEQVCGPLAALETKSADSSGSLPSERMVAEAPSPSQVHASPAPLPVPMPPPIVHTTPAQGSLAVAVAVDGGGAAGAPLTLSNPALRRVVAPVPPPPLEATFDLAVGALTPTGNAVPAGTEPRRAPPPIPRPTPPAGTVPSASSPPGPNAVPPSTPPGRYAAPRPAAIFNQTPPEKQSIFGESVISEQSLDEVILSYLAEDLAERPQK